MRAILNSRSGLVWQDSKSFVWLLLKYFIVGILQETLLRWAPVSADQTW
jgi:hypothetical protein